MDAEGLKSVATVVRGFLHSQTAGEARPLMEDEVETKEFNEWRQQMEHVYHTATLHIISRHTGLEPDHIRRAMKAAEDDFVHWHHPTEAELNRYALREHAKSLGLEGWQPGTGF